MNEILNNAQDYLVGIYRRDICMHYHVSPCYVHGLGGVSVGKKFW